MSTIAGSRLTSNKVYWWAEGSNFRLVPWLVKFVERLYPPVLQSTTIAYCGAYGKAPFEPVRIVLPHPCNCPCYS